jgi:hypothetical protein
MNAGENRSAPILEAQDKQQHYIGPGDVLTRTG